MLSIPALNLTKATDITTPDGIFVYMNKIREYLDLFVAVAQIYPDYIVLNPKQFGAYMQTMNAAAEIFSLPPLTQAYTPRFDGILVIKQEDTATQKPQENAVLSPIQLNENGNNQETKNNG